MPRHGAVDKNTQRPRFAGLKQYSEEAKCRRADREFDNAHICDQLAKNMAVGTGGLIEQVFDQQLKQRKSMDKKTSRTALEAAATKKLHTSLDVSAKRNAREDFAYKAQSATPSN